MTKKELKQIDFSKMPRSVRKMSKQTAGMGMSFFANVLIAALQKKKRKVLICDTGESYKKICELFNVKKGEIKP